MATPSKLKLVSPLKPVSEQVKGTAAAEVNPAEPTMPKKVREDDELRELWEEIVPDLLDAGLLAKSDGPAIEMAIRHFRAARDASDDLSIGEPTVWDEKNARPMKNPSEVVFRSESLAFLEYAKQLGMTFAARARTPMPKGADGGDANPFIPQAQ